MATVKALASGFTYQPIDHLATEAPIEEALARLLAVQTQAGPKEIPKERDAEALLGGAKKPMITVTEAFETYLSEIAYKAPPKWESSFPPSSPCSSMKSARAQTVSKLAHSETGAHSVSATTSRRRRIVP